MRTKIIQTMQKIADESGYSLDSNINDATVLLDSGLDSLGFAILVATLEEDLGYDPFSMMEDPSYPTTFGDLLSIYSKYEP